MTNKPTQQELEKQAIEKIAVFLRDEDYYKAKETDLKYSRHWINSDHKIRYEGYARLLLGKLRSLNLLRTGEEVYLDPDQTTSKNPCDDCKFFIRNEGCRRPDSICWSRHFYNGQQELIDRGFKKVCVSPHKEEWKDKPYGEGWWDYWILFTEGMAKEYLGQYIYDGRYFLTKCGKGFNCSRTKYEDGCYIDGMSEGKWQKAIVPEGVEKDGKPNID